MAAEFPRMPRLLRDTVRDLGAHPVGLLGGAAFGYPREQINDDEVSVRGIAGTMALAGVDLMDYLVLMAGAGVLSRTSWGQGIAQHPWVVTGGAWFKAFGAAGVGYALGKTAGVAKKVIAPRKKADHNPFIGYVQHLGRNAVNHRM